ncbi:hypothetical protein DFH08DRAFT_1089408 [Mycena albidolilacea]|uniref:Uncharacterized protein n=1 Tax=Mycena albidolilacea TaxID=1033008 RepID=A0AAD7E8U8_9AGAR|nr:hypothetical protein DFH08DRAFT_1089408 [Mycena albidolilacea]
MSSSTPAFPPELEREIFETIAYHYPEMIANLLLVSRRTYEWIDRMQYTTVTSYETQWTCQAKHLVRAIQSNSKPASFFHCHVRRVFLTATPITDIGQILSACGGIQNLMLAFQKLSESVISGIAGLKPRRLGLSWESLPKDANPHMPVFAFLTHFHMLSHLSAPKSTVRLSSFLAQLPVLTHFAAFCNPDRGDFAVAARDILTACKALRVFVLNPIYWRKNSEFSESLPSMDDVRFVYLYLGFGNCHLWNGWISQTRGGIDFWARADAFVAKKGRGEIQPASRCWIEPPDCVPEFDPL